MGQSKCGRTAAALAMISLGLPPVFAMDRVATDRDAGGLGHAPVVVAGASPLATGPCPTRFDYVVLASFADAPSLLSLSTYHFRSEMGFSPIPITGLLQVGYQADSGAGDCRSRGLRGQTG